MIAVPNISSWQALTFGGAWLRLDPPRRLYHLDPASFRAILDVAGFSRNQLYERLKGTPGAASPLALMFQAALATALLPRTAIATVAEAMFGCGGTIECLDP